MSITRRHSDSTEATQPAQTPWVRSIVTALGVAVAIGIVLLAFIWPTITAEAKNLPVVVSGPSQQVQTVTSALEKNTGDLFDLTTVDDRAAAVSKIEEQDAYGAIVLGDKPEVLSASANGTAITPIMGKVAGLLEKQLNEAAAARAAAMGKQAPHVTVPVTDVVSSSSEEGGGVGFMLAYFPLLIGGVLAGVLVSLLVAGVWRRIAAVLVYSAAGGTVIVAILQGWFGVLQRDAFVNGLAVSLALLATSAFIVGMNALLGRAGIAVGAVFTMLVANPLSAAMVPVQFLPEPWGAIGQWLVPGAQMTLLRDLSFFPDADASFGWLVLGGWALGGLILVCIGYFRSVPAAEVAVETHMGEHERVPQSV